jgi:hypothetical protein
MYKVLTKKINIEKFEEELNKMEQEGFVFVSVEDGARVYKKKE